jgi:hypothetical protein
MLKWLQQQECFPFPQISWILSGSCNCLASGARDGILILRTRHPILPNTKMPCCSTWRMNTVLNNEMCRSLNSNAYRAVISSPLQLLLDAVNHSLIHKICPAMMKNTYRLIMWPRQHMDDAIAQHAYWPHPGSIRIPHLKHHRTGGKSMQISISTTLTQWGLAVNLGYRK